VNVGIPALDSRAAALSARPHSCARSVVVLLLRLMLPVNLLGMVLTMSMLLSSLLLRLLRLRGRERGRWLARMMIVQGRQRVLSAVESPCLAAHAN